MLLFFVALVIKFSASTVRFKAACRVLYLDIVTSAFAKDKPEQMLHLREKNAPLDAGCKAWIHYEIYFAVSSGIRSLISFSVSMSLRLYIFSARTFFGS